VYPLTLVSDRQLEVFGPSDARQISGPVTCQSQQRLRMIENITRRKPLTFPPDRARTENVVEPEPNPGCKSEWLCFRVLVRATAVKKATT